MELHWKTKNYRTAFGSGVAATGLGLFTVVDAGLTASGKSRELITGAKHFEMLSLGIILIAATIGLIAITLLEKSNVKCHNWLFYDDKDARYTIEDNNELNSQQAPIRGAFGLVGISGGAAFLALGCNEIAGGRGWTIPNMPHHAINATLFLAIGAAFILTMLASKGQPSLALQDPRLHFPCHQHI